MSLLPVSLLPADLQPVLRDPELPVPAPAVRLPPVDPGVVARLPPADLRLVLRGSEVVLLLVPLPPGHQQPVLREPAPVPVPWRPVRRPPEFPPPGDPRVQPECLERGHPAPGRSGTGETR
ncbi:hypothetical protein [Streptomyces sp. 1331.2]|uniref:hypothetical protein n=1 Tax=Streptomyces sp. 1331.2 TaxID=1938835 RepID=UPI00117BE788|nr:hypothetical protein [Streptomyces sp. 1331.2]